MNTKTLTLTYLCLLSLVLLFASCEDPIDVNLEKAEPVLVIDAWVNALPEKQTIRLSQTQPYFENAFPSGVSGATVQLQSGSDTYVFSEETKGDYTWTPDVGQPSLGNIGNDYRLTITINGSTYEAYSTMRPVPDIDSITFRFEEKNAFFPDSYFAEFWAKDMPGSGNAYWIKAYKNGKYLNKPDQINIAYDAGFSAGSGFDGIEFIRPIRDGINPIDEDDDDRFLSPYSDGDSVYVEIHSLTEEAFVFLNEVTEQTDRPGGFGELFAGPLFNVSTNIVKTSGNGVEAVGFFNVAAISGDGKKFVK